MPDPSVLTSGGTVAAAEGASMFCRRKIAVTKLLGRVARPTGAVLAAVAAGWTLSAPPVVGTATSPLARRVERNSSKYSDRESGRCVTTETLPCTDESMMNVRPVTRAASSMKARMSASSRLSTYCDQAGVANTQTRHKTSQQNEKDAG